MTDCGVCLDYCVDGRCEFYERAEVTARKPRRCCECGGVIEPGTKYEKVSGKYEGEFFTCKTCLICAEIRNVFSCGGAVLHECLWEGMRDYVYPELTTANKCFQQLSATAKQFLLAKWQRWKGFHQEKASK